ncbi:unnamed protein product [Larinioides sclopetarius]
MSFISFLIERNFSAVVRRNLNLIQRLSSSSDKKKEISSAADCHSSGFQLSSFQNDYDKRDKNFFLVSASNYALNVPAVSWNHFDQFVFVNLSLNSAIMPKKGEIFWEVGKSLTKETWVKGEFVTSPEFPITNTCSLIVKFYPAGIDDSERPSFLITRTSSEAAFKMSGECQLCHGITIVKIYIFEDNYENGQSSLPIWVLKDIGSLRRLKIFHSLPELCYRLLYTITEA